MKELDRRFVSVQQIYKHHINSKYSKFANIEILDEFLAHFAFNSLDLFQRIWKKKVQAFLICCTRRYIILPVFMIMVDLNE